MNYTKEYFLEKAHEVHDDKFDYSKVNYINQTTKVCITCPKHGDFWQAPYLHLKGRGCNQCAIEGRKMTKEIFVQKAREIHGDKYDYSKVKYKTTEDKVCIICPKHGEFWQTPHMHISDRNGYPKCSKNHGSGKDGALTFQEFVERAQKRHGTKYTYIEENFNGAPNPMVIICPIYGEFIQVGHNHLNGNGCPKCGRIKIATDLKLGNEEFIKRAKEVHGDKYGYSKVDYKASDEKVCIICPKHGEFWQVPTCHVRQKQGCPICGKERLSQLKMKTTDQFIADAKKVHGDRYDYSKVEYKGTHIPVIIGCSEHGDFKQIPCDHLHGRGCPKCGMQFGITEQKVENQLRGVLDTVVCQYRPKFLHGKTSSLSLDFYLPDYNAAVEYHGAQHFTPIERFGGEEGFAKIQERDKRKYQKCLEEEIKSFINEVFNYQDPIREYGR